MAKQYLGTKLQDLGNINVLDPTDKIVIVQPKDEGVMQLKEFFFYVQSNLDLSNYYTTVQASALFAKKTEVYTRTESEAKFAYLDRTYSRVQSDTKYAPKDDVYNKAQSDERYAQTDYSYAKTDLYTKDETFQTFALKTEIPILPDLSPYSTTAKGDLRWAMKAETYNKIDSDARFAPLNRSYSKTEEDDRFAKRIDTYTKAETDTKFIDVNEGYDRVFIQNNIYFKPELYTRLESDNRFALKNNVYTIAAVNEQFAAKSWVYSRGEAETKFAPVATTYTKLETNTLVNTRVDAVAADLAGNYYTKVNSDAKFATLALTYSRIVSDGKYALISNTLTTTQLTAKYYDKMQVDGLFAAIDWTPYLKKTDAAATYATKATTLTKDVIESKYYTRAQVDQAIADAEQGLVTDTSERYITHGYADERFANVNSVYTKLESDASYATLALTYSRIASDARYYLKAEVDSAISTSATTTLSTAANLYLTKTLAASTYITTATATSTLANKTTVYTKAEADARYHVKDSSYSKAEGDERYLKVGLGTLTVTSASNTGDSSIINLNTTSDTNLESGRVVWNNKAQSIGNLRVFNTVTNEAQFALDLRTNFTTAPSRTLTVTPTYIEHAVYGKLENYFAPISTTYTKVLIDGMLTDIRNDYVKTSTGNARYATIANLTTLDTTVTNLSARVTADRTYLDGTFYKKADVYNKTESDGRYFNSSSELLEINANLRTASGIGLRLKNLDVGGKSPSLEFQSAVGISGLIHASKLIDATSFLHFYTRDVTNKQIEAMVLSEDGIRHSLYGDLHTYFAKSSETYTKAESDAKFSSSANAIYNKAESDARYGLKSDLTALTGRVSTEEGKLTALTTNLTNNYHPKSTTYTRVEADGRYVSSLTNQIKITDNAGDLNPLALHFAAKTTATDLGGVRWSRGSDVYTLITSIPAGGKGKLQFSKMVGAVTNGIFVASDDGIWNSAYGDLHTYFAKVSDYYDRTTVDGKLTTLAGTVYTKAQTDAKVTELDNRVYNKTEVLNKTELAAAHYTKVQSDANYYSKTQSDANYYTRTLSDGRYPLKTDVYTKLESDANYYTKTVADGKYALKTDGYTKAESDARYYQKAEVYTKAQSDANYYTKALGDARYEYVGVAYDKATSDGKYALKTDDYTKAESDARYYQKADVYTKAQSDANYYTKTVGDARYEYMGVAYTKAQSDAKYPLKTDNYTKGESDVQYIKRTELPGDLSNLIPFLNTDNSPERIANPGTTLAGWYNIAVFPNSSNTTYAEFIVRGQVNNFIGTIHFSVSCVYGSSAVITVLNKQQHSLDYPCVSAIEVVVGTNGQVIRIKLDKNVTGTIYIEKMRSTGGTGTPTCKILPTLVAKGVDTATLTAEATALAPIVVSASSRSFVLDCSDYTSSIQSNNRVDSSVGFLAGTTTDNVNVSDTGVIFASGTHETKLFTSGQDFLISYKGANTLRVTPTGISHVVYGDLHTYFARSVDVYTKGVADARYEYMGVAYTKAQSDAKYALKTDDYTKAESDARYHQKTVTYTRTESDARYINYTDTLITITGNNANAIGTGLVLTNSNAAGKSGGIQFNSAVGQSGLIHASRLANAISTFHFYTRTTTGTEVESLRMNTSGIWHSLYGDLHTYFAQSSEYYSKVEADARYPLKTASYTKAETDARFYDTGQANARFEYVGVAYTKAQSDANYYTKVQSDANYYTKTVGDARYEYMGVAYTKAQADAKYALKTDDYTKAESDARYYQKADVYSKTELSGIIMAADTRATNQNPQWYVTNYPGREAREFKTASAIGVPGVSGYSGLTTNFTYGDTSGGLPTQMVHAGSNQLFIRAGVSTTAWSSWLELESVTGADSKYWTKAVADSRYAYSADVYTKVQSDGKYALKTDDYTKAESDARYYQKADVYTKVQSDANYYTKAVGDGRYEYMGVAYTKAQSDAKYALKTDDYTKAESDARYYKMADNLIVITDSTSTTDGTGLRLDTTHATRTTTPLLDFTVRAVRSGCMYYTTNANKSSQLTINLANAVGTQINSVKVTHDGIWHNLYGNLHTYFATMTDIYTRAQGDARYEYVGIAYTKAQSDAKYALKTDDYTKAESDARYHQKTVTYTRVESDGRYYLKADVYTKAQSDANYYTKTAANSTFAKVWTGTPAQYNAIATKDANTIYIVT